MAAVKSVDEKSNNSAQKGELFSYSQVIMMIRAADVTVHQNEEDRNGGGLCGGMWIK